MKPLSFSLSPRATGFRVAVPLLMLGVGVGGAGLVTALTPPTYQAQASVLVTGTATRTAPSRVDQAMLQSATQSLMPTVVRLAKSNTVALATAAEAGLPADLVTDSIDADAQPNVQIITLTAKAGTPKRASAIANALARTLETQLTRRPLSGETLLRVKGRQLDRAAPPRQPVQPQPLLNAAVGGLLGLISGFGLVSFRENRDDRLYSPGEMESELGTLTLAVVPRLSSRLKRRGARMVYDHADFRAATRTAIGALAAVSPPTRCKRVLITSVRDDDGKTMVATLLALGLAEQHEQVTLVEGQLHSPTLARHFPEVREHTLQDMLGRDSAPVHHPLITHPRLCVIPAQTTNPQNSAALLRSQNFTRFLDDVADRNDMVLVNAPPVLGSPDFAALARQCDVVILVARAGHTSGRDAGRVLQLLQRIDTPIAGLIVTDTPEDRRRDRRPPTPLPEPPDSSGDRLPPARTPQNLGRARAAHQAFTPTAADHSRRMNTTAMKGKKS
ncbi:polysaccharide biosynthesis tyrosine autokinase [Streptomyces tailanensis]|uniref:polysaccharide biosynthesis tyrosine autokinase n=1 Tax=Streptomyces tailanensis TaxID=2569858 RepID=UPI00122E4CAC|nr:polysaccharide biosynthesis tyrosine autokinase [Streptomyces tailanensis]